MKKLTKAQAKQIETSCGEVSEAFGDLNEACEAHNEAAEGEARDAAKKKVEAAVARYNELLDHLRTHCEEIAGEIREYIDGKSERWQESDAATNYEAWAEEWEQGIEDVTLGGLDQGDGRLGTDDLEDYGEAVSGYQEEVPG